MAPPGRQPRHARLVHGLHRARRSIRAGAVMVGREPDVRQHLPAIGDRDSRVAEPRLRLGREELRRARRQPVVQRRRGDGDDLEDRRGGAAAEHACIAHRAADQPEEEHEQERRDGDDGHDTDGADIQRGERLQREPDEARL